MDEQDLKYTLYNLMIKIINYDNIITDSSSIYN